MIYNRKGNNIEYEKELASQFLLETEDIIWKNSIRKIVILSSVNVAKVEAMIKTDSAYKNVIDDIIEFSNSNISRNGFDHLLWYYHKGDS